MPFVLPQQTISIHQIRSTRSLRLTVEMAPRAITVMPALDDVATNPLCGVESDTKDLYR